MCIVATVSSTNTVVIPLQTLFQYPNQMHVLTLKVHLVGIITVFKAQECTEWKTLKCMIQLFSSKRLHVQPVHVNDRVTLPK